MFFIAGDGVWEQEGEAKYFLFPKDIDLLAVNEKLRRKVLESFGESLIGVSSTTPARIKPMGFAGLLGVGSGIHSKL